MLKTTRIPHASGSSREASPVVAAHCQDEGFVSDLAGDEGHSPEYGRLCHFCHIPYQFLPDRRRNISKDSPLKVTKL